jgi:hypothetical protein
MVIHLLIHFPLTLFFLAPVFTLFAGFAKTMTRCTFLISALTVMRDSERLANMQQRETSVESFRTRKRVWRP